MRGSIIGLAAVSLAAAGCATQPARDAPQTQLAFGRSIFEQTCATCHSVAPPPLAAPPMSHVARHYLDAEPDAEAAAHRITAWIAAPSAQKSALPAHAIERWGLMPPQLLPERDRRAVAAYVLTLADQHAGMGVGDSAGHGGMGMGGGTRHGAGMGMGAGAQHRNGPQPAIPPRTEALVTAVGEPAAAALRTGLLQRLTAALSSGGPARAIDVCALEALPLTDSIAAAAGNGIALKRTSTRVRNPLNAPDALESEALQWFEDEKAAGRSPTRLVQSDGADYRYYAPLRIARPCLACHGPGEAMSDEVRRALHSRYPGDRATGYAEGDLRGVIRVSVPAAALR